MNFTNIPYQIDTPNKKFPTPLLPTEWLGKHPTEQLDIKVMGKVAGTILTIHPIMEVVNAARKLKVKECEDKLLATLDKASFPLKV